MNSKLFSNVQHLDQLVSEFQFGQAGVSNYETQEAFQALVNKLY
jgi:hypothetical protein